MSEKKTGGPAFPVEETADINGNEGMTLRDYFAGQAVIGFMVGVEYRNVSSMEDVAEVSYKLADDMIKERTK